MRAATLALAVAVLGAVIPPALGSAAEAEPPPVVPIGSGGYRLNFNVTPKRLPSNPPAPATLDLGIEEEAGTYGGAPPGLSTMTFDLPGVIDFEPLGLPVCRRPGVQISSQGDAVAGDECSRAVVGHGELMIGFYFPESTPIKIPARLTVYNGGIVRGALQLLVEATVQAPLSATLRLRATVRPRRRAGGSEATIEVPTLSEGAGRLQSFELEIGRRIIRDRKPMGFVSARCHGGKIAAAMIAVLTDGTTATDESIRACRS